MRFDKQVYEVYNTDTMETPSLLYYRDIIAANTRKAIEMAGGAGRLIPHVKSHKMAEVVRLQMELGINRFKCATIAEAEMTAECGAREIVLAYPLVGPAIGRFVQLQERYPGTVFYAVGDDRSQIELLVRAAVEAGLRLRLLVDVNMGMNRTGVPLNRLEEFCRDCAAMGPELTLSGLHCYDGHNTAADRGERNAAADRAMGRILAIREELERDGYLLPVIVAGGTPSFLCYQKREDILLSPGTLFLSDYGYAKTYADLPFVPGAVVMARVISHPEANLFTIDAGVKAIAADPTGERGILVGLPEARPVLQNEEHWVFRMKDGEPRPAIGTVVYVIPTHICPTSALYPAALVVQDGEVTGRWEVTARNRKLTI